MIVYVKSSFKPRRKKRKVVGPVAKKLTAKQLRAITTVELPKYRKSDTSIPSHTTQGLFVPARRSMMDPTTLAKEPEHVREAIIAKSKRIAIAYNKGGYVFLSEGMDPKTIGRK